MKTLFKVIAKISNGMQWFSGLTLCGVMVLTFADIVLRRFGYPVVGAYEITSFLGGIVVGLAIPSTSLANGHIFVDFIINKVTDAHKGVLQVTTRIMGIFLFSVLGYFLISMAWNLYVRGEVSMACKLPFYPIAAGIGMGCFVQVLVLTLEVVKIYGRNHE
jgi:TRAP-type C4-dicarboxylate transport system permease small subunit